MRNLKGPPATSEAPPTTSEGALAFISDNAAMPTIRINISFAIVEIKKCANLQQIRSERDIHIFIEQWRHNWASGSESTYSYKWHDFSILEY